MSTALADSREYVSQSGQSYRIEQVLQEETSPSQKICLAVDLQEINNRLHSSANHVRLVQDTIPVGEE
ncbi:calcium/calmodulin dependent protein kinase [Blastomyces dermatitidis ATCC 18188]|uniref:Calcium/calmodulin dependent protein kinase n=1 Tax=Ajellomyces dermatitidis (strain ATCC 18188 / CBS 674.68) TaxID=653446 RepID=F2TMT5_AJEDA|nr:calcium/calmodulin dependent protein kinase [Blastomyces dermatitidis ATCC 18188]